MTTTYLNSTLLILIIMFSIILAASLASIFFSLNITLSAFSLVFLMLSNSFILLLADIEFYSLIYSMIYVGAVLVFFIFILMTINLRFEDTWEYQDEIYKDRNFSFFILVAASFFFQNFFYFNVNTSASLIGNLVNLNRLVPMHTIYFRKKPGLFKKYSEFGLSGRSETKQQDFTFYEFCDVSKMTSKLKGSSFVPVRSQSATNFEEFLNSIYLTSRSFFNRFQHQKLFDNPLVLVKGRKDGILFTSEWRAKEFSFLVEKTTVAFNPYRVNSDVQIIGIDLFGNYSASVIVITFILLFAMIASIGFAMRSYNT